MAKTKTAKTTKGSRKSNPKYLGVKLYGGQKVQPGAIVLRQRGTKFYPGEGIGMGRDHTLFAEKEGIVTFYTRRGKKYVSVAKSS